MKRKYPQHEEGFVLVAALLILLVLTVMGVAVNRNTMTEWKIAMNDRVHKETFYSADAATELATEVLVQSIACLGFNEADETDADVDGGMKIPGSAGHNFYIEEKALGFWRNYNVEGIPIPSEVDRHMVYPAVFDAGTGKFDREKTDSQPHANIYVGGNTKLEGGEATQQSDGYRGKGKGLGAGGISLVYDINVQQVRPQDGSESVICVQYKHRPGMEGDCNY